MVRYRGFVRIGHVVKRSPRMRSPEMAWWWCVGSAEDLGEHLHTVRDLVGKAEAGTVAEPTTGGIATYTVVRLDPTGDPIEREGDSHDRTR